MLLVTIIITVVGLLYVTLKNYLVDYVDGKVLVDPISMTINSFKDPGTIFGIVVAWFIERRYVNYSIEGTTYEKITRCIIGIALMIAYYTIVINGISKLININIVYFLTRASLPILCICVYPLTWSNRKKKAK